MSLLFYLELTEIFIQISSKKFVLGSYEEFASKIASISKPTQILSIKNVTNYTVISSGFYFVPNDIIISNCAELIIEPGVILYFAQGKGIISFGKLTVVGSHDDLIVITGNKWANISIMGEASQDTKIKHAIIEGGQSRSRVPTYGDTFRSWNDSLLGGNIYLEDSHLIMDNSFILNGFAEFGGGLFLYKSSIDFNNILVFNNKGKSTVGGIELFWTKHQPSKPSKIKNSQIIKNSGAQAGGIYAHEGNVHLENLIIKNNRSSLSCGGISISQTNKFDLADIRLRNSIIEENLGSVCGDYSVEILNLF